MRPFLYSDDDGKTCPKCEEYLAFSEYYYFAKRNIYSSWCKECERQKAHENYNLYKKHQYKNEYWLILNNPGSFKTPEEEFQTHQLLNKMGWKFNEIYKCWLKPGVKEVVDGQIRWLRMKAEPILKRRYITRGKKKDMLKRSMEYRTVERPDYETLKQQVYELGYRATGRLYGKSDNGIRKWLRFYEKIYSIK